MVRLLAMGVRLLWASAIEVLTVMEVRRAEDWPGASPGPGFRRDDGDGGEDRAIGK